MLELMTYKIDVVMPDRDELDRINRLVQTRNAQKFLGYPAGTLMLRCVVIDNFYRYITLVIEPAMIPELDLADWSLLLHR